MPDKVMPGPVQDTACIREAVCIHTKKIFDSCRDKDCIEDLRFYPTQSSQCAIDRAISIKAGKAELLYVYIDVEPIGFNRGFYTVDVRYFYRVTADAFVGAARPVEVCGLCVFDKRVILFGSEGTAKVFSSEAVFDGLDEQVIMKSNMPTAVVEAVIYPQTLDRLKTLQEKNIPLVTTPGRGPKFGPLPVLPRPYAPVGHEQQHDKAPALLAVGPSVTASGRSWLPTP